MIYLKDIKKSYRDKKKGTFEAIKSVSLRVEKGDIYGIIGHSGAGKSTLLRTINLLEKPDEGEVFIEGKNIIDLGKKELRNVRRSIAMIFQHFNLINNKTVFQNVSFPLEISGMSASDRKKRVKECLSIVQLEDKLSYYPSNLSGGQKQRVAIARAIATRPKILLCDEPTSALDPQTTDNILSFLKEINHRFGITIVIVTHEINVVQSICNKVSIMDKGNLIETINLSENDYNPKSEIGKRFLKDYEAERREINV